MNELYPDKKKLSEEISKALDVLKRGGIILYPTDSIWGIGCDATNEEAVRKIFELKKRTEAKSLIVLLDNEQKLLSYVRQVPEMAWQLIEFAEKPLTIIYPSAKNLAKNIIAEDGSIAVRICRDEFCANLIQRFRKPIVSTSANVSGENFPENFSRITDEIISGVDCVVDLRQHEMGVGIPSTLIKMGLKGEVKFLRE